VLAHTIGDALIWCDSAPYFILKRRTTYGNAELYHYVYASRDYIIIICVYMSEEIQENI
jgi:hypothetical protein